MEDSLISPNLNHDQNQLITKPKRESLCLSCKGGKFLCGKTRCPLLIRINSYFRSASLVKSTDFDGVCPPGVFVGRIGYPFVYAGPLVPPIHEDTSSYDQPESWFGKTIDEIVGFRSLLVRGKHQVNVKKFEESGKIMDQTFDLALSVKPVDVELSLKRKPSPSFILDDQIQPFGPSAPLKKMQISNSRWDKQIQKVYFDNDLSATNAVTSLFQKGILVTKIQRAFSVGAFGNKNQRRLVPTRWSITAVDDIISKDMINKIKNFPLINEYRVYESKYLDNRFEVLFLPNNWSYELMETWLPGTFWNEHANNVAVSSDWEGIKGRTTYASVGGSYYAARLAVGEELLKDRRQASVLILREIHPKYIMPIGVWQVRENVRNAMKQKPQKFNTLKEALSQIGTQLQIPLNQWINKSNIIKNALFQKKITDYIRSSKL